MHLQELSDRRLPYFFGIICTSFLAYFFYTKSGLQQSSVIISAILAALILITVISLFWQISAHAAGVGGLIGGLMGIIIHFGENYLNIPFFISLLIGGFVISARLKLNAHNPAQVIAGFACGFTCGLMGAYFL